MTRENKDRFTIHALTGKDICDNVYQEGERVNCEVTYVKKHNAAGLHVINVKMHRDIPTDGIDLFVDSSVLSKIVRGES